MTSEQQAGIPPEIMRGKNRGCPCACHNGREVHHMVPCHNPMLRPGDRRLPRSIIDDLEEQLDGR